MSVRTIDGKPLIVGGKVVTNRACCCDFCQGLTDIYLTWHIASCCVDQWGTVEFLGVEGYLTPDTGDTYYLDYYDPGGFLYQGLKFTDDDSGTFTNRCPGTPIITDPATQIVYNYGPWHFLVQCTMVDNVRTFAVTVSSFDTGNVFHASGVHLDGATVGNDEPNCNNTSVIKFFGGGVTLQRI